MVTDEISLSHAARLSLLLTLDGRDPSSDLLRLLHTEENIQLRLSPFVYIGPSGSFLLKIVAYQVHGSSSRTYFIVIGWTSPEMLQNFRRLEWDLLMGYLYSRKIMTYSSPITKIQCVPWFVSFNILVLENVWVLTAKEQKNRPGKLFVTNSFGYGLR